MTAPTALDRRSKRLWQLVARRYAALEQTLSDDEDPAIVPRTLVQLERLSVELQDLGEAYDRLMLEGARQ